MRRAANTVEQYLSSLPADRRAQIAPVLDVVRANVPRGYEEGVQHGMICWYIPLSRYPDTYNKAPLGLVSLAAQKNNNALYLMTVYGDPRLEASFRAGFKAAGKKLDMGKSCVRFKTADALALDVIGDTLQQVSVDDYIAKYEAVRATTRTGAAKAAAKKPAAKKSAAKKPAANKPTAKKAAAKKAAAKKAPPPPADAVASAAKEAAAQAKSTVATASTAVTSPPPAPPGPASSSRLPLAAAAVAGVLALVVALLVARRNSDD